MNTPPPPPSLPLPQLPPPLLPPPPTHVPSFPPLTRSLDEPISSHPLQASALELSHPPSPAPNSAPYSDNPSKSTPPPPSTIQLITPPLTLADRTQNLHLNFTATIHLTLPSEAAQNWRDHVLVRAPGFHISVTLTHNSLPHPVEPFGRLLASAPMWHQLGFVPALAIYDDNDEVRIMLARTGPSSVEALLPALLPTAGVPTIQLRFAFTGPGELTVSRARGLADVAVRSFWRDKVIRHAPLLGRPGLLGECEVRREYVDVIAGVLEKFRPKGGAEDGLGVEGMLWKVVLGHTKSSGKLEGLGITDDDSIGEGRKILEEGMASEDEATVDEELLFNDFGDGGSVNEDFLWDEEVGSDDGLLLLEDSGDDGIISESEDEFWEALETKQDSGEDENILESYERDEMMGMVW